ncbi:uncharacterized protein LOC131683405 [Topomyia yanbarensis]|uniref:uncharacterized protein LOC131683405 n=1 Tax=Topomyia yanbarensis TaxID=2498891 RepID=UPI00273B2A4E|nr:uncharacterized protein LOC131683405 [Topomyia yanbarensis]XP_058821340.1 uncharacterized protein LOC131683405 [Topomyia yanbarensis]XP_058821341.1 uncharacterized protein LOC131683405 [Topomyia yanbarensis]XP_058821342.1 uncharacterized protein LOC131683405 [Topomyia yanbarensis]XP_058821343.1 uncharacterized protein LOC131683405 [Topomyia yanbarensis]XP_058821344.1 uncharacterized protein LOC131683405 [Topomyia yanbarensis]XP_058821345.1 uncharacterized protein LOC131683405 [Topomyia yan
MTSSYCSHHQCNNVAFATIVFLLTTMIDMREQTMLTEYPPTTEAVPYSKQISSSSKLSSPSVPMSATEKILLNVTTTDTLTPSEQLRENFSTPQYETAALPQSPPTIAAASSQPTTVVPSSSLTTGAQTVDQHKSNYSIKFTTFRPLLVPTLPDIRHRIIHSMPYQSKHHHERHWGPFFEEPLNVTSGALQVGYHLSTEAILNCRVGMLKDKTVMWIRRTTDKVSLLTVGNNTYSGDPRIRVKFQYPNNWRLHINPIKNDDGGLYMCQVSTHPPRVFATNLTVLEPAVRIVDEMGYEFYDRYYKLGSTIDISCQVSLSYLATLPVRTRPVSTGHDANSLQMVPSGGDSTGGINSASTTNSKLFNEGATTSNNNKDKAKQSLPQNIVWKKDSTELPKDIKLSYSLSKQWFNSRLSIRQAERIHSGIYTCTVADKQTISAQIQVLNGETPAAVQHNRGDRERTISALIFYCVLCWIQLHISYT